MLHAASASSPGTPAVLAFACGACGTGLEVPVALAGVTGPCPVCGAQITAPSWVPAVTTHVAEKPSELLARPPRVREMPLPEPPVGQTPVRPLPAPPLEENTVTAPAVLSRLALETTSSVPSPQQPAASVKTPRGLFDGNKSHRDDANEVVHRKPLTFRRRGLMRWVDLGIVGVFTGLCIACLAALRYTVPARDNSMPGLPPNLNELVENESRDLKRRQLEAEILAKGSVERFLGSTREAELGSTREAGLSHLLPPPPGLEMPALPAFAGMDLKALGVDSSRRIPGTDRFIVTLKPAHAPGPVFVVEQTDRGPLLHSGVITQQTAGLFEKFINEQGSGSSVTLYAEVRPALPSTEREFRALNPNLASYQLLELRPLGKEEPQLVCMPVNGDAAQVFARRSHDIAWRRCIAALRWAKDPGGVDFVEIARFHPGTWSGDISPKHPQTALTAGPTR